MREARAALNEHRARIERARKAADFLRHAVEELGTLAPQPGEEAALAERRLVMMQAEKVAQDLADAFDALAGQGSPVPTLSAALRKLERRGAQAPALVDPCVRALDAALVAIDEARGALEQAIRADRVRSARARAGRGAAVRAARRGAQIRRAGRRLAELRERYAADVQAIDAGEEQLGALERAVAEADAAYVAAARTLSAGRRRAAKALDGAVQAELPPLRLERARFIAEIAADEEGRDPAGFDRVEFWAQTNPGTKPGPLMKVASGGELSRFMLALKVVLADKGSAPTLVFDEIDTGVGGAVADAIGQRLARLALARAGDGRHPRAAGRGAGRQPFPHPKEAVASAEAGRDPRHAARRHAAPRGDRPHARRRDHHRRGPRRGRKAAAGRGVGPISPGGDLCEGFGRSLSLRREALPARRFFRK